jgi:hypothetical protein
MKVARLMAVLLLTSLNLGVQAVQISFKDISGNVYMIDLPFVYGNTTNQEWYESVAKELNKDRAEIQIIWGRDGVVPDNSDPIKYDLTKEGGFMVRLLSPATAQGSASAGGAGSDGGSVQAASKAISSKDWVEARLENGSKGGFVLGIFDIDNLTNEQLYQALARTTVRSLDQLEIMDKNKQVVPVNSSIVGKLFERNQNGLQFDFKFVDKPVGRAGSNSSVMAHLWRDFLPSEGSASAQGSATAEGFANAMVETKFYIKSNGNGMLITIKHRRGDPILASALYDKVSEASGHSVQNISLLHEGQLVKNDRNPLDFGDGANLTMIIRVNTAELPPEAAAAKKELDAAAEARMVQVYFGELNNVPVYLNVDPEWTCKYFIEYVADQTDTFPENISLSVKEVLVPNDNRTLIDFIRSLGLKNLGEISLVEIVETKGKATSGSAEGSATAERSASAGGAGSDSGSATAASVYYPGMPLLGVAPSYEILVARLKEATKGQDIKNLIDNHLDFGPNSTNPDNANVAVIEFILTKLLNVRDKDLPKLKLDTKIRDLSILLNQYRVRALTVSFRITKGVPAHEIVAEYVLDQPFEFGSTTNLDLYNSVARVLKIDSGRIKIFFMNKEISNNSDPVRYDLTSKNLLHVHKDV